MSTLFISDLHLDQDHPESAEIFIRFLATDARHASALYILGDFFEAWIGDDDLTPFNQAIIDALHNATVSGLPIYIMHGNRDFLIGKRFLRATGCRLLKDEHIIQLNGQSTLLMHGDTLCREDKAYLRARRLTRHWFFKTYVLMKSLEKRRLMAAHYREKSKAYVRTASSTIMDVTQDEVKRIMLKHGVLQLIHGHTHRRDVHHFELDGKPATRTVLGDWHEQGNVLVCHADGKQEFKML